MRTYRFYHHAPLALGETCLLDANTCHQIINVLRLKPGQEIWLFNNTSFDLQAVITNIERHKVWAEIKSQQINTAESPCKIHLVQAIAKGQNMDYAIQKAVELGVTAITPLITERTVVHLAADKIAARTEHWQKIITHACSQSGRSIVPVLYPPIKFDHWLASNTAELAIILSPTSSATLAQVPVKAAVSLLIGPEGGFSAAEIALACQHNCMAIALGPRVLRSETAGIVAIAGLQLLFGDLR